MAFVCTLAQEAELQVFTKIGSALVLLPIGYDDENDVSFNMAVGFDTNPGEVEYWFHIVKIDHMACTEEPMWLGKQVSQLIAKVDKPMVLAALIAATTALLDAWKPVQFFMCTYEADLPPKALEKHDQVCKLFNDAGYKVTRTDPFYGKRGWMMER